MKARRIVLLVLGGLLLVSVLNGDLFRAARLVWLISTGHGDVFRPSAEHENQQARSPVPESSATPQASAGWKMSEETDAMYGGETVVLKRYAENSGDSLLIQCDRKSTQIAYGVWAGAMPIGGTVPVLVKMDQTSPEEMRWQYDPAGWYRAPKAVNFARRLTHANRLLLEYRSATGSRVSDEFDLTGLSDLLPKVASACGWRL